jgi:hypothetical protein
MNSESLGHYYFGQAKTEKNQVSSSTNQIQEGARCQKGICEVSWKPSPPSAKTEPVERKFASHND